MNKNIEVRILELMKRVERLESRIRSDKAGEDKHLTKLPVRIASKTVFIPLDDIHSIEADGRYARIYLSNSNRFLPYSLKKLESMLDPTKFIRLHKSWIISSNKVLYTENCESGDSIAILENNQKIRISRRYKDNLRFLFEQSNEAVTAS